VLLLAFIPPLITVNRFQRRISTSIGASLGRPVHFKSASLSLLPLPGLTLENFVVEEDPAFGSEPILRAGEVHANLRIGSLWSRRIEFSKISLTDPSVNLVHTADGHWNLESILFHASHIDAAPTAQPRPGPAPRFPYIEATGARVNLKLDHGGIQEKTPYSLTEADFALWLPQPGQWRIRLEAHPARTDIAPADTGTLHLEAVLGGIQPEANTAVSLDAPTRPFANFPIDLHATWQDARLGGISRLALGRDIGLRGDLTLDLSVLGHLNQASINAHIKLDQVRRSDFIPPRLLSIEATCLAIARNTFQAYPSIECHWPPASSADPSVLILSAAVPDVHQPRSGSATINLPALSATTLLDWLRVATPYPPTGLTGPGTLAGTFSWNVTHPTTEPTHPSKPSARGERPQLAPLWSAELQLAGESIQLPALGPKPISLGDLLLRSAPQPPSPHASSKPPSPATMTPPIPNSFDLSPISLPLGGHQPATLEGHFDAHGYTLHLTGPAIPGRLLALGDAIPQFGEGLRQLLTPPAPDPAPTVDPTPIHLDLTATRTWGTPQIWRQTTPLPPDHPHHH
jgi:AsmA protein